MNILALEFSSSRRSVAILGQGHEMLAMVSEQHGKTTGMAMVEQVIRDSRLAPEQMDLFAVGLGPGSYAGIRSAIAIAQGWQLGISTPTVGVSSIECLAEEARKEGLRDEWSIIVDAQRAEVYHARYFFDGHAAMPRSQLAIVPIANLSALKPLAGPDVARLVPSGHSLFPSAATLARLAESRIAVPAEKLEPIYLRETTFVKAPPPRGY